MVRAMSNMIQNVFEKAKSDLNMKTGSPTKTLMLIAALCAVLPLDIDSLLFSLLGMAGYAMWHIQIATPRQPQKTVGKAKACYPVVEAKKRQASEWFQPRRSHRDVSPPVVSQTAAPVLPRTFRSTGWEAEVNELIGQIAPTPESQMAVAAIVRVVKRAIRPVFPDAEVTGFVIANLSGRTAFGVAVPDVDIIINLSPEALQRISPAHGGRMGPRELQKAAIRSCTDRLISAGGVKFRRSAFGGEEPKVTLLVPASTGIFPDAVAFDLSVNSSMSRYHAALLEQYGEMEPRARALMMMVRRWSKDRAVCHVAKGHLHPYAWSLLTVFFLQAGDTEEGPRLPPYGEHSSRSVSTLKGWGSSISVGQLFQQFVRFYLDFDWQQVGVSVRLGQMASRSSLPAGGASRVTTVHLCVEDPCKPSRNLGASMTAESFGRLKEELARADQLCRGGASLTELLEPWVPPEYSSQQGVKVVEGHCESQ